MLAALQLYTVMDLYIANLRAQRRVAERRASRSVIDRCLQ